MLDQAEDVVAQPDAAVRRLARVCASAAPSDPTPRREDDAQRDEVGDVIQIPITLHLHLVPQGVQLLRPADDLNTHVLGTQCRIGRERPLEDHDGVVQRLAELPLPLSQPAVQLLVLLGVQVHERRVLELRLERPQSHAVREWREYVEGLPAYLFLLLRFHVGQSPHVVQSVGELDDDDAIVVRHGDEHLSQILGLFVGVIRERELGQFRYLRFPLDDVAHLESEHRLDLLEREIRILDGVVEQSGHDRARVHLHPRQE